MNLPVQPSAPARPTEAFERPWVGQVGLAWAQRNPISAEATDWSYEQRFGITRTAVNLWALKGVPRGASILEVGCAAGAQLHALAAIGFTQLYGCDVCPEAVKGCSFPARVADGRALVYADGAFDLVMTSGTLMHLSPANGDRKRFIAELDRVAGRWIYGAEGASATEKHWLFGDLVPPAWTDRFPDPLLPLLPGWRLVRSQWLKSRIGPIDLSVYLLERHA